MPIPEAVETASDDGTSVVVLDFPERGLTNEQRGELLHVFMQIVAVAEKEAHLHDHILDALTNVRDGNYDVISSAPHQRKLKLAPAGSHRCVAHRHFKYASSVIPGKTVDGITFAAVPTDSWTRSYLWNKQGIDVQPREIRFADFYTEEWGGEEEPITGEHLGALVGDSGVISVPHVLDCIKRQGGGQPGRLHMDGKENVALVKGAQGHPIVLVATWVIVNDKPLGWVIKGRSPTEEIPLNARILY